MSKPAVPLELTFTEIEAASKSLSNKKSFGPDGIPQNFFKDSINIT